MKLKNPYNGLCIETFTDAITEHYKARGYVEQVDAPKKPTRRRSAKTETKED